MPEPTVPATRQEIDPVELGERAVYRLLNCVVIPRPIAWVSSRSAAGVDNLAPHSFFTVASTDPPVVQFTSVGSKDSLRNVEATGEFVVNVCPEELRVRVNWTSTDCPPDVSEFDEAGLTREPSAAVAPYRVAESPVALECRLAGTRSFGSCTVVFGQVVHVAIADRVMRDGRPRAELMRPVARLGSNEWTKLGETFRLRRIPWSEWREGARE